MIEMLEEIRVGLGIRAMLRHVFQDGRDQSEQSSNQKTEI